MSRERRYGDFCELKKNWRLISQEEIFDMNGSDMDGDHIKKLKCAYIAIELPKKQKRQFCHATEISFCTFLLINQVLRFLEGLMIFVCSVEENYFLARFLMNIRSVFTL